MKLLLTGASSFTGYWFAEALVRAGHRVVAPLRRPRAAYTEGVRAERVARLAAIADIIEDCPLGSLAFLELCARARFDVFCHHAARVGDYRSADFDVLAAAEENTRGLRAALQGLRENGLKAMVLTGTVFEAGEGRGEEPLVAFSPYGLSKTITAQITAFHCQALQVPLHKFVIANPFGPLQEPRLPTYLMGQWRQGEAAHLATPDYVRDHIPVDLLAACYRRYVEDAAAGGAEATLHPSLYAESLHQFAERMAREVRARTGLACQLSCQPQTEFTEPKTRINMDDARAYIPDWNEAAAWDGVVDSFFSK